MELQIGLRSDAIEARYSFEWLFQLMSELEVHHLELAGFPAMVLLPDGYFQRLRAEASAFGVRIASVATGHRECAGLMSGDDDLEQAAAAVFRRYVEIAGLVGAGLAGLSAGSVPRDRMSHKEKALDAFIGRMHGFMHMARDEGLGGLVLEPMSCAAEPPSTPAEIDDVLGRLCAYHSAHRASTVPVFTCADTSHGVLDRNGELAHDHMELFRHALPHAATLHLRNTDRTYGPALGFSEAERRLGVVDVGEVARAVREAAPRNGAAPLLAFAEHPGPRLGRNDQDHRLRTMIEDSVRALRELRRLCAGNA